MPRRIIAALIVGVLATVAHAQVREQGYPNTRRLGRATVEYRDKQGLQVVLGYEYSQRHHDSAWLLIDFGARAEQRLVLDREHFKLASQAGGWFPVASQRHFVEDGRVITSLRQNASIWRRDLGTYLGSLDRRERLKFFALPGEGVIVTGAMLDKDRITLGEIYFEMPAGSWEPGRYSLLLEHPHAKAALPIVLE
jgi:hypothetical protein